MKRMLALVVGCLLALGVGAEGAWGATTKAGKNLEFPRGELVKYPVTPTFEAVDLKLDPDKTNYTGSVRIDLKVDKPTRGFGFFAEDMTLDRLELTGEKGPVTVKTESGEEGLLRAAAERALAPGAYRLSIDFHKEFNTKAVGLYRMETEGRGYLCTQFEAVDARKGFPCWDEPVFKIPFQLTVHLPQTQQAVTGTPVESEKKEEGGWKTLVFERTKPLPSYLIAIAAGPLESVPIEGMSVPGRVYTVAGQSGLAGAAARATPPILAALEKHFGRPYPYAKLDLIALPEFWPGAMENAGLVTFADRLLLIDPKSASMGQQETLVSVTAHELAHMWFGDLVTMRWWDDLWLNESFASWMGDKIAQELYPQYRVNISSVQGVQGLMAQDARPSTKPIRKKVVTKADIEEDFGLAYGKGQTVLEMFERWLGPETFRKGATKYLEAHAWGNATAADLWGALSEASGQDVTKAMSSFLSQPGFPLVSVKVAPGGAVLLEQKRFLNRGVTAPEQTWTLPVGLKYSDGRETHARTVLLPSRKQTVVLGGKIEWVMPNAGAYGYYRWQVPDEMLFRLADEASNALDERERVGYLGNAAALLDAAVIGGDGYLRILNAFAGDPEPEVISSVMGGLGKVQFAFVPDELKESFAAYVRETLGPALKRFGLEKHEGEAEVVSLFRPELLGWLGVEGMDPEIRSYAAALAKKYLADPASVDPSVAGSALRVAATGGGSGIVRGLQGGLREGPGPGRAIPVSGRDGLLRGPGDSDEGAAVLALGAAAGQRAFHDRPEPPAARGEPRPGV